MHGLSQRRSTLAGLLFCALVLTSEVAQPAALARKPEPVTFTKDPKVCIVEWTSTGMGNEYYSYQLYGNGRLESRIYRDPSNPMPSDHSTTDLTPDELAVWLDDIVDSGLYGYSQGDIDRRVAATGKMRMTVSDRGSIWVRIQYQELQGEPPTTKAKVNVFLGDDSWSQSDRFPEIPQLSAALRLSQRFWQAQKAGIARSAPFEPSPLAILKWTAEERARAGWTSD